MWVSAGTLTVLTRRWRRLWTISDFPVNTVRRWSTFSSNTAEKSLVNFSTESPLTNEVKAELLSGHERRRKRFRKLGKLRRYPTQRRSGDWFRRSPGRVALYSSCKPEVKKTATRLSEECGNIYLQHTNIKTFSSWVMLRDTTKQRCDGSMSRNTSLHYIQDVKTVFVVRIKKTCRN